RVRAACADVDFEKHGIDRKRSIHFLEDRILFFFEPSFPELHGQGIADFDRGAICTASVFTSGAGSEGRCSPARTAAGRPMTLINPSASVSKEPRSSRYRLYGDLRLAIVMLPL